MIKRLKHKLTLITAITKEKALFIGYIFIYNTDLMAGRFYSLRYEIDNVLLDMQWAIDS